MAETKINKLKLITAVFLLSALILGGWFSLSYKKRIYIFANNDDNPISKDRTTFLVLGKTGKVIGWNFSPELADTIILIDYRPKIGALNLISLPRDLYVTVDNESFKLNEVVKRNKINGFLNELSQITGLKTDKYVVVDIELLKNIVDGVGGVDLELKSDAVDWASGYTIKAGKQHLDGNQAVWLSRNRFASDGDFFRERNQHDIIKAIIHKFKNLGPIDKMAFVFKITPELSKLQTNLDFSQLIPLIEKASNIRFNNVVMDFKSGILQSSSVQYGSSSAYILVPRKGQNDYTEIKDYIQSKLEK